jgi:predicted amidophosphoribosyltransferase
MVSAITDTPRKCPFCEAETNERMCTSCHRDTAAIRKICSACGKMTPKKEDYCCHCRKKFRSDLAWKIPIIILLFLLVLVISILVNMN